MTASDNQPLTPGAPVELVDPGKLGAVTHALSNVERAAVAVVEHRANYDPEPEEVPVPDPAPPADAPRVRTLGPASYVGISAGVLGLGAVIAGAVLYDRGKVLENDPGAYILEYTDYRPAGAALLGVGIGAVAPPLRTHPFHRSPRLGVDELRHSEFAVENSKPNLRKE